MPRLLILCLGCIVILSCQKEIEPLSTETNNTSNTCKLTKSYIYDLSGTISDSAIYTYSGDKPIKVSGNSNSDSLVLQYTGNNITKRIYYQSGVSSGYDNLFYNPDGTIRLIEQFMDMSIFGGGMERVDSILFNYNNGKLVKRSLYSLDLFGPGLVLDEENLFQYTGNNITKSIRLQGSADTTIIQYDSQP